MTPSRPRFDTAFRRFWALGLALTLPLLAAGLWTAWTIEAAHLSARLEVGLDLTRRALQERVASLAGDAALLAEAPAVLSFGRVRSAAARARVGALMEALMAAHPGLTAIRLIDEAEMVRLHLARGKDRALWQAPGAADAGLAELAGGAGGRRLAFRWLGEGAMRIALSTEPRHGTRRLTVVLDGDLAGPFQRSHAEMMLEDRLSLSLATADGTPILARRPLRPGPAQRTWQLSFDAAAAAREAANDVVGDLPELAPLPWVLQAEAAMTPWPRLAASLLPVPLLLAGLTAGATALVAGWVAGQHGQVARARASLAASEERRRCMFQAHGAIQLILDADTGAIIEANPAAEAFYGLPAEELARLDIFHLTPIRRSRVRAALNQVLAGAATHFEFTQRTERMTGTRPAEVYLNPVEHEGRRLIYAIIHDITQRREVERALVEARRRAEAASQAKSDFLAMMSHELRTPLNAILGFAQMIEGEVLGPVGAAPYRDYAGDIRGSGERLLAIINTILDLSKIEAGSMDISDDTIDLRGLLYGIRDLLELQARQGQLTLAVAVPRGLPLLIGDRRLVDQAITNLAANAIKFTPAGGRVTLAAMLATDGGLEIAVTDTGIGIAPEEIPTALALFGQVGDVMARRYEGTGLGLPLAKLIVERHGGSLQLDSAPGKGTRVSARFPPRRTQAPATRLAS